MKSNKVTKLLGKLWQKTTDTFIKPIINLKTKITNYAAQGPKEKKKVRIYSIVIGIILLFFLFSIVRGIGRGIAAKKQAEKPRITPIYTQVSNPKNVTEQFKINGNVMAENSINIVPDIGGKLIRYVVEVGDTVTRGQTVAYIDPSKPGTSYNLNPVPAPLGGVISSLPIELGNTVTTTTVVAQMGDLSRLKIETYVPERFVEMIHIGKEASVYTIAFPNETFKARIYEFAPTLDPTTRTLLVKLRVTEGQDKLLSGMFSELVIDARTIRNVLTVPPEAIITRSGKNYVYIVIKEPGTTSTPREIKALKRKFKDEDLKSIDSGYYDGKAKMVAVETGIQSGNNLIITQGLNPGDAVVYSGQELLSDGGLVRIMSFEEQSGEISALAKSNVDDQAEVMEEVVDEPNSVEVEITSVTSETESSDNNPAAQASSSQTLPAGEDVTIENPGTSAQSEFATTPQVQPQSNPQPAATQNIQQGSVQSTAESGQTQAETSPNMAADKPQGQE